MIGLSYLPRNPREFGLWLVLVLAGTFAVRSLIVFAYHAVNLR